MYIEGLVRSVTHVSDGTRANSRLVITSEMPTYSLTTEENRVASRQVWFKAHIAWLRSVHDTHGLVQNKPAFTSPKALPKGMPFPLFPRGTMNAIKEEEDYDKEYASWLTQSIASYTHVTRSTAIRRVNPEIWKLCPSFAHALVDLATDPNIDHYINDIVRQLYDSPDDKEVQQITASDHIAEQAIGVPDNERPSCPVNVERVVSGPTGFTTEYLM